MTIGCFQPGTNSGIVLQMMGSRKTVPPYEKKKLMKPFVCETEDIRGCFGVFRLVKATFFSI